MEGFIHLDDDGVDLTSNVDDAVGDIEGHFWELASDEFKDESQNRKGQAAEANSKNHEKENFALIILISLMIYRSSLGK